MGGAWIHHTSNNIDYIGIGGDAGKTGKTHQNYSDFQYTGGGGGGYGGGGGGGWATNGMYAGEGGHGGGGGYLETASIKLTSLDIIPVTVGNGGKGGTKETSMNGTDGEASSFGEYLTASGATGGSGYNDTSSMASISPGVGGTSGGKAYGLGGGGGGGYLIGCNIRGNGGDSGIYSYNAYSYSGKDGIGTGGGGAGRYFTKITENAAITMGGPGKGGPLGGGAAGQDGGPGHGVVVVTW